MFLVAYNQEQYTEGYVSDEGNVGLNKGIKNSVPFFG
jgi:hypothetical protein